jgi:hypothetical protein
LAVVLLLIVCYRATLSPPRQRGLHCLSPKPSRTKHPAKSPMQNASSRPTELSATPVPTKGTQVLANFGKPRLASPPCLIIRILMVSLGSVEGRGGSQQEEVKYITPFFLFSLLRHALYSPKIRARVCLSMPHAMIMSASFV